jgi:2-polyprenyl-6-methoxyphenol hydroxylase-like FAD-dependent oxidoreductase
MELMAKPRSTVAERFDVAIVGARCAGAPLAALLARRGVRVALIEQTTFPRNTLSSHFTQNDALTFLNRLGVLDRVRATGAPFISHVDTRLEDLEFVTTWPERPGDVGGAVCVRRHVLDPILADAAAAAGVDVRMGCKVVDLLREHGRVVGVRVVQDGCERDLRAPLVVGADGRSSLVARLAGARSYHVTHNERSYYWGYFEGVDAGPVPTFYFHRWADRFVWAAPTDSGLFLAGVSPELVQLDEFGRDRDAAYLEQVRSCAPVAEVLGGARRAGKLHGIKRFTGYFRDACGPGWVLVGDAGHFKDPAGGRGIGDAFMQVEKLVPTIVEGLAGGRGELDRALAEWARWRDAEFVEHYWMATDLGCAGAIATPFPQIVRRIVAQGKEGPFIDLLSHRSRPSAVLSPGRAVVATAGLLARPSGDRRALIREVGELLSNECRRRWLRFRPAYETREQPMAVRVPRPTATPAGLQGS